MTNLLYANLSAPQNPPAYRKIFPSYDWDEDVWRVNQIVNMPKILGKENMGFMKNVPNEEVKKSDAAIQRWIDANLVGCSCLVVFVGERTYQSKWVKYEMMQAKAKGMGRLLVSLEGMKDPEGRVSLGGPDPYAANGLYAPPGTPNTYTISSYSWLADDGKNNIGDWIEDACHRAGK